jgi:hypothetical protein
MGCVLAGDADAIVVWKVSRFSRNWREAAQDVETLLDNGKDLLSEEGFDTATAGGRLLLRILFSLANWEHDVLGENWEVIKAKAVRDRGSHLGNAPLGYTSGRGGQLEPNDDAALVVELFEMRASGATWAQIADRLDDTHPRPGNRRDRKDVERIITSRVYVGETRWRDEINPEAHPAIVSPELWERANAVSTNDVPRQPKRSPSRDFPLSGWLRCSGCGGPMGGSVDTPRGVARPNYKCSRRRGGCPHPQSISAQIAEDWAITQAADMYATVRMEGIEEDGALARALSERDQVEGALHDLASVEMRRELGEDWLPMMRKLRAEKADVEKRLTIGRQRRPAQVIAWDDLEREDQWGVLRDMAPSGALVGPRGGRPVDRLRFVDDLESGTVLEG